MANKPNKTFEALDAAPVMLWVTEKDNSCSYLSSQWYETTGQTPETGLGFGWLDAVHPDDIEMTKTTFLEAAKNHAPFEIDYRLKTKSGDYRWTIDAGSPRFSEAGEFEGYTGVVFDIHARKIAESRLSLALQSGNIGFWDWDARTGYTYLSDSLMEDWGIDKSKYQNTLDEALARIHPEDVEPAWQAIQESTTTGKNYDVQYRVIRPNKEVIWINAKGKLLLDEKGEYRRLSGITINITQRKNLEDQLAENAARFQSYAEAMPQMAFISDADGNMLYFNKRHYEYFGFEPQEEEGWKWVEQGTPHPDDIDSTVKAWTKALETGTEYNIEYRLKRHDGEYRWHLGKALPIRDLEGNIIQWFGTNTDIHEGKLYEKKLEEQKAALERTKEELTKAVSSRDEFISVASHELKTPLTSIGLLYEILRHQISEEGLSDEVEETVQSLESQSDKLNRLISDLLDITKIQAGKFQLELEKFDLLSFLQEFVDQYQSQAKATKTELVLNVPSHLEAQWDRQKMEQVFSNLIENALKYAPGGALEISAELTDGEFSIKVRDEGAGISKEKQATIFEKFQRATSARKISGLGLGLFITKQIIELHQGSIVVESEIGKGAEFIIKIAQSPKV